MGRWRCGWGLRYTKGLRVETAEAIARARAEGGAFRSDRGAGAAGAGASAGGS